MSEKRKDSKGRILRDGEYQREDGRYEYKYIDNGGDRRSIYSWRLVETDKLPAGKRQCRPLRDMEKEISDGLAKNLSIWERNKTTLNLCYDEYLAKLNSVRKSTKDEYEDIYNRNVRNSIGNMVLSQIDYDTVKHLYNSLAYERHMKYGTMSGIDMQIKHAFDVAVKKNLIPRDPSRGILKEFGKDKKLKNPKKKSMTIKEQERFINYLMFEPVYAKWRPMFTFLLGTGCRVGEVVAIKWGDCDLVNNVIHITNGATMYKDNDGVTRTHIENPKTDSSIRTIPMLTTVRNALLEEKEKQGNTINPDSFVFQKNDGGHLTTGAVRCRMRKIVCGFNETEIELAKKENRVPNLLKNVSPHTLRHTFCTRFCENETNLKLIQSIMGHANISVTMDIYNDASEEDKAESIKRLENKIHLGN